jgi:hypothetical protein
LAPALSPLDFFPMLRWKNKLYIKVVVGLFY